MASRRRLSLGASSSSSAKPAASKPLDLVDDLCNFVTLAGSDYTGDEPTDNYSDGEGAEDPLDSRRRRKQATKLVAAQMNHLASMVKRDKDLHAGAIISNRTPDNEGNLGVNIMGVTDTNEETFRRVRGLDRTHESQLHAKRMVVSDQANGTQEIAGHRVTINQRVLISRWLDSEKWKRDAVIALSACFIGFALFYYGYLDISPYLT